MVRPSVLNASQENINQILERIIVFYVVQDITNQTQNRLFASNVKKDQFKTYLDKLHAIYVFLDMFNLRKVRIIVLLANRLFINLITEKRNA